MRLSLANRRARNSICTALVCLICGTGAAAEVALAGILSNKALLTVDGGAPQSVSVGQSLGGVKLLSVDRDQAVVEVDGRRRLLRVGQHAAGSAGGAPGGGQVVLAADGSGHFVTNGAVNGVPMRFVVDTGATLVSLGASDARRAGIDATRGRVGRSHTANGVTAISIVKLDSVRVGDVTLYNIEAAVHQGDLPVALLGMSFLNRMEMHRDGATMTLKKRF